jgi:ABC-type bacteriocin/lantibiotic exporter with double-glycine peptidase domain
MSLAQAARLRVCVACAVCTWLGACAQYTGTGRALAPSVWESERGWLSIAHVPVLRQRSEHDCGPTALAMVLAYWRQRPDARAVLDLYDHKRYSAAELRDRARALGFSAFVIAGTFEDIVHELEQKRPVIVGMAKPTVGGVVAHYEVVVGLHAATQRIATLDPALGWRQNSVAGFLHEWVPAGQLLLIVLGPATGPVTPPDPAAKAVARSSESP